jgi:effector-binding domain-containing protein
MSIRDIRYKQIEAIRITSLKQVIQDRSEIPALFEPLRRACGEAICGPAMVIFHGGAVKDGSLVEAAYPVSQPVEAKGITTRQLERVSAWTAIYTGPRKDIHPAIMDLYRYVRQRADIVKGGTRQIYLVTDPEDPVYNLTEIQLPMQRWDQRLANGVESVMGPEAREQVMTGIEAITPESPSETYTEWIRGAMDRIDTLTDDDELKYEVVSRCAHIFPPERITYLRAIYEQRREVDDVLREMYTDPAWYEDPVREGNVLYLTKVPFDPQGYENGVTAAERRKSYCHCNFVKPYLDEVPAKMPATFCWCGAGWYSQLWGGILGQPVQIELLETILQGSDHCRLAITLPFEMEGELGINN